MILLPAPKVFFVRLDGVLYAAVHSSEAMAKFWMNNVLAEAYFHHLEESDTLREAHQTALNILAQMPPEQAEQLRNIPDQECYGTCKIEDHAAPELNITFAH